MKNSIGTSIILTVFGESHGKAVGVVIDGLTPGLEVSDELIKEALTKRRPLNNETQRKELDNYEILSGVYNGYTTGTPLCLIVYNENNKNSDYDEWRNLARPSQVDYSAYCKYHGYEDYHGSGHFSGRVTAGIVASAAILRQALEKKGIYIGSHILSFGKKQDQKFNGTLAELQSLKEKDIPFLQLSKEDFDEEIKKALLNNDSIGGQIETEIIGLPAGVGEPWFDSLESKISQALFGIGGIKGIDFGLGFEQTNQFGSRVNDEFYLEKGKIKTKTNNSGGLNGGITNGMPVLFKVAVKPTASISKKQKTVNFVELKEAELELIGRHDPAFVRRLCIVIDSLISFIIADMLVLRYGTDYLK